MAIDDDTITHLEWSIGEQHDRTKDILDRILGCQADGDTGDAQPGDD